MSSLRLSALVPLLALILPALRAERLGQTYRKMKRAQETSAAPVYYLESLKERSAKGTAEGLEARGLSELDKAGAAVLEMKKSWDEKATAPATQALFYDFGSEAFQQARSQARSDKLDALLIKPVEMEFLLGAAFERNPKIAALQEAWKAAIERYPQSVYLDNILQQYNAFTKQLHTKTPGTQRQKEMVAMKFPFPGTLALKGDIIGKEVQIAAKDYAIGVRDVITATRMAFYDYLYLLQAIRITEENQKILGDFESTARKKYEGGQATFNDVIKAQVELSKLSDDLITLRQNRDTIMARINTLLNRDPGAKLGPPTEVRDRDVPLPLEKLYPLAIEEQQEIQRILLMVEKMDLVIEMGSKMFYPDASLGASYFEDRSGILAGQPRQREAFRPAPELKHRFWFGKDDAYLREVRKKRDALREGLRAKKDAVNFDLEKTHSQLDAARRQRELYQRTLLPQAKQNLQTARVAYQGAKVGFLDLLDAERLWLSFNLSLHRSVRDYRKHFARLEQVVGKRLGE